MLRKVTTLTTILLIGGAAALAAAAQAPPPRGEAGNPGQSDPAMRPADLRDLASLESMAARFDAARAAKDEDAIRSIHADLKHAAATELKRVKEDERRMRAERSAPKELSLSIMMEPAPARQEPGPSAEDLAKAGERRQEIAVRLRHLDMSMAPADLDQDRALMRELIEIARMEMSARTR